MPALDPHKLDAWLVAGSLVLLVAVLGVRLTLKTGLPSLLLYLGLGLLIGEAGFGFEFSNAELTQNLGLLGLALILAEGGLTTRWEVVRPAVPFAIVLATVGVFISVTVVATSAYFLLGFSIQQALLLGAVVSSTDAAAVFSVLRNIPLPRRLTSALEAESGFNDAPVVILVTLLSSDSWQENSIWEVLFTVFSELAIGAAIGLAVAWLGQQLLSRISLPAVGLYPLATLAIALLSYASAGLLHGSGFLAVYITGLWLGNARLPHRRATLAFAEGTAWLSQIGLFVLLGLLASPSRLPEAIVPALVAGAILTVVARPLSVRVSSLPFAIPWREQAFLSWAGLRGAVPIVLATIPLTAQIDGGTRIFDIVFVLVVIYTLLQGPTLPVAARVLGISESARSREMSVDAAPLDEMNADLLQFTIPQDSLMHGVTVIELRLPTSANVTLVVRDGRTSMPDPEQRLRHGDQLLIVTTAAVRELVEARLQAVNEFGRLAQWVDEADDIAASNPSWFSRTWTRIAANRF